MEVSPTATVLGLQAVKVDKVRRLVLKDQAVAVAVE
jgi:hypothetical protein